MTQKFFFGPTAGAWNFSDFQTWKILVAQITVNVASKISGKFQIFFREFFGAEFFKISGQSWIHFSGHVRRFSGIRRAVRGAVATFFSMEVSMPVPVWHHLVQIIGVNADHQAYLIVAMPMFLILTSLSGDRCFFKLCCCRTQFKGHFCRCKKTL